MDNKKRITAKDLRDNKFVRTVMRGHISWRRGVFSIIEQPPGVFLIATSMVELLGLDHLRKRYYYTTLEDL